MPKYSLIFQTGLYEERYIDTRQQARYQVYAWYKTIVARREEKRKVRINNESIEIVSCAEDKSDFTGVLFKNYMIFVLAPVNYFRQFGDTI